MMQFTLGLAILAFTAIVGSYQFIDNMGLIESKERALMAAKMEAQQREDIFNKFQEFKDLALEQGLDQKFAIERMLGIGDPGPEFSFVGQSRNLTSQPIYRHNFRIQGPVTFLGAMQLIKKLSTLPGFAVYKVCYGCGKLPEGFSEDHHVISIEGYLYVYDATRGA